MSTRIQEAAAHVFRRALERNAPEEAIASAWRVLEGDDESAGALLDASDGPAARLGMAGLTSLEACTIAVVDRNGVVRYADERLLRWVGQPSASPACRRLIAKAVDGKAVGLVETLDGGVLAVCAAAHTDAQRWPLPPPAAKALARPGGVILLAFAPSRSGDLVLRAAQAFGLTGLESRVVEALLEAPSLEIAADNIGVGRETAKDALGAAMRKAGVARSSQLLGRIVELSCGALGGASDDHASIGPALGLTASESRVALALADGATADQAAAALGLSPQTVKSYRKAVFAKTGVNRARDLRRLVSESQELTRLSDMAELAFDPLEPDEQLRVVVGGQGRRIAFVDHGPPGGRPVFVGHGAATGRRVPPPLLHALRAEGFRPIVPQRPGYGLTDPARGEYLPTSADDMLVIADALGLDRFSLLMREGGCATAFAFGAAHPERLDRRVLFNPRSPKSADLMPASLSDRLSRALLHQPGVIRPFAEMLRRQTRSDLLEKTLRHTYEEVPIDQATIAQPTVLAHLVRDVQGLMSRTTAGFVAELATYADGWTLPASPSGRWIMAYSEALYRSEDDLRIWLDAPEIEVTPLKDAGLLAQFTHADALVALLR